jgi:hypothetical protein
MMCHTLKNPLAEEIDHVRNHRIGSVSHWGCDHHRDSLGRVSPSTASDSDFCPGRGQAKTGHGRLVTALTVPTAIAFSGLVETI